VAAPTLSGQVTLTVPPHSNSGRVLRLKGKGLPGSGGEAAGDLYAKLVVMLPDHPDSELESFARSWKAEYDPRGRVK
jgi:DnaJ-class molecular chaperone